MSDRRFTRRLVLAGAGASLVPGAGLAQPVRGRRIATLSGASLAAGMANWQAFHESMRRLGYGEDELGIESRWADGHNERLPGLAAELVGLAPEVIVTGSSAAALAVKQATSIIPIVTVFTADPIGAGLAASLARPGGNLTGLSNLQENLAAKDLELLKSAVPSVTRIAVLINPGNPSHGHEWGGAQEVARALRVELLPVEVRVPGEIDGAFITVRSGRAEALLVLADPLFSQEANRIADLAASYRLPAIYGFRGHVAAGGLMSYGPDITDSYRRAAVFVDKILKGARPSDLPIEQPTKFELVINVQAARALGLELPPELFARADEVIE
jgi:putative tryptophan/tyrosine transport system substrate-binding protein